MEIAQIMTNVFGEYPSVTSQINYSQYTLEQHVKELSNWLADKQSKLATVDESPTAQMCDGRIGPAVIVFDIKEDTPIVNISKDKLTVQSHTAFLTVKANCCVFKGKWMYEVQLRSKGVMQIGWCSAKCKFTQDTGVGDTRNSYGLDGSKQRLWHVHTRKYGPYWRSGDIYGVCLDMDAGKLEYYRNGVALGEAFTDIERGPGIALYPAFSLAFNDSVTANFGGSPFRHPVEGYTPLQTYPEYILNKAEFLLQHLINLSRVISTYKPNPLQLNTSSNSDLTQPTPEAVHMVLAGLLISELSSIINNSYVIEDKIFTFVRSMCVFRSDTHANGVIYPGLPESTLGTFLTLLWVYLEPREIKRFISNIVNYLSSMYRETPVDLEYIKQRMVIVVLTCICNHPMTRKYLLEYKFFKKNCLPIFLYIKPPDESTLGELLPDEQIWTEGLGGPKGQYMSACQKLIQSTDALYVLQKNLVENILNNNDNDDRTPSSRKIFVTKLQKYVVENSFEHRTFYFLQGNYTTPTQPAVALSFLCILLDVLKNLFSEENPDKKAYIAPNNFYNGSFIYSHLDRLGGVLSHLKKVYRKELIEMIGVNNSFISLPDAPADIRRSDLSIYSAMFLITGSASTSFSLVGHSGSYNMERPTEPTYIPISPGNLDSYLSANSLLDCCILYYYAVAHKYIVMIADLRDNIGLLSEILIETKTTYEYVKNAIEVLRSDNMVNSSQDDILKELHERFGDRKNVFAQRSMELARKQAWYRSVALGTRRRNLLSWMLGTIFNTLKDASNEGGLFAFVPEVYVNILPILLDTVLDFSFHDLKGQYDLSDLSNIVQAAAEFLSEHSADSRVVLASCKDSLLQALGTLTCHEAGIHALENTSPEGQLILISALLRPYENRAWGQSNWLLIRFWLGEGFAFRDSRPPCVWQGGDQQKPQGLYRSRGKNGSHTGLLHHIAPACPSPYFHQLICQVLMEDEPFSTIFMNSILSQLNWAFSEFILLLQEIQNNAQRQEQQVAVETRQLKICAMCFELTVSLMRSLEMLLSVAPDIFKDSTRQNSDLLMSRVCQLISLVLSRVTVPPGCFQYVVDMCLPDLSVVTHFSIISAALGILLSVLKDELISDDNMTHVPRISKCLLTDPSFQIASLEFALGEIETPIKVQQNAPRGNFDPKMRGHIDPLTNEVRIQAGREPRTDPPIIQFNLRHYTSHVSEDEIKMVRNMIDIMLKRQSIMSDVTLPSDDSLCPICYSKSVSAIFEPCKHQSCNNCIVQHLMNSKVCFYCKTFIIFVKNFEGFMIYENSSTSLLPDLSE